MSIVTEVDVERSASELLADLYTAAHITHGDGQANLHATVRGWLSAGRLPEPTDILIRAGQQAAANRVQRIRYLLERQRDAVLAAARERVAPSAGSGNE